MKTAIAIVGLTALWVVFQVRYAVCKAAGFPSWYTYRLTCEFDHKVEQLERIMKQGN